ncbi:hypothetical protein H5410_017918 [Solanum commersonii]|uniref:Uncharacterized protein n=1 Tax=Solanum commersonii TaxID=4109 RepID=A0A9J6A0F8_SOLCO|nr:hypothetical protein H5410_017918 [Solanum commersonii]
MTSSTLKDAQGFCLLKGLTITYVQSKVAEQLELGHLPSVIPQQIHQLWNSIIFNNCLRVLHTIKIVRTCKFPQSNTCFHSNISEVGLNATRLSSALDSATAANSISVIRQLICNSPFSFSIIFAKQSKALVSVIFLLFNKLPLANFHSAIAQLTLSLAFTSGGSNSLSFSFLLLSFAIALTVSSSSAKLYKVVAAAICASAELLSFSNFNKGGIPFSSTIIFLFRSLSRAKVANA